MKANAAVLVVLLIGVAPVGVGCSGGTAVQPGVDAVGAGEKGKHGEWWCPEHGVPEEVCAQCDAGLVSSFKAKGDWCQEHNRPDTQCFVCHPELEAKFAALYEAKYGEAPPKPTEAAGHDDDHDHDHKHDEKPS